MIKQIKSLVVGLALLTGLNSFGATFTTNLTGFMTNTLIATNITVSSITVSAATLPTGTNAVVYFFDQKGHTNTYAFAAYTNRVTVSTNVTTIFTNTVGLTQTNIYPGQWTYTTTTAAATNVLPIAASFAVVANGTSTQTGNWSFVNGLTVQNVNNTTNVTVTVEYFQNY